MTGLPAASPLDPKMWAPALIADAWLRVDPLDPDDLMRLPNVREWVNSSPARYDAFRALVARVKRDLLDWSARGLGIIPAGVGGITLAVERHGILGVGKWTAEAHEFEARLALSQLFAEAGLGPEVLACSEAGLLTAKVEPGTPLRSLGPSLARLRAASELLPRLRDLPIPASVPLASAATVLTRDRLEIPADGTYRDEDGFEARAAAHSTKALAVLGLLPNALGHGDFQLGNVLQSHDEHLALIDAAGTCEPGYLDAARLVVHTTADALGTALEWDVRRIVKSVARWSDLDADVLTTCCLAQSATSAWIIRRTVAQRVWEWTAHDSIVRCLEQ